MTFLINNYLLYHYSKYYTFISQCINKLLNGILISEQKLLMKRLFSEWLTN